MRKIIALLGESGVGKTTIFNRLVEDYDLIPILETTTRPKRPKESEGNPYSFTTLEDFEQLIVKKEIFGVSCFKTNNMGEFKYGIKEVSIPKKGVCVLQANWQSVESLKKHLKDELITVKIIRNDKDKLISLLNREAIANVPEVCERFIRDKQKYDNIITDFVVYNNDIEYTSNYIYNLIKGDYFE